MTDYTFTFSKKKIYTMDITAKDDDAAEEKFWKKLEKITEKQWDELEVSDEDIEIESIE